MSVPPNPPRKSTTGPLQPVTGSQPTRAMPRQPVGTPPSTKRSPVQPASGPGSPLTESGRRASSSSRMRKISLTGTPAPSGRVAGGQPGGAYWTCSACSKSLPKDALVKGLGDLVDGKLLCSDCLGGRKRKAEKAKAAPPKMSWGLVGAVAVLFAAASFFFPGQVLFVLIMVCTLLILVGAIGFTLRGVWRFILAGLGVCGIVTCLVALSHMRERERSEQENERLRGKAEAVLQALEGKNASYMEAQSRLRIFLSECTGPYGEFTSREAENWFRKIDSRVDTWLKENYGEMDQSERSVLSRLMIEFGEREASGGNRFSEFEVSNNTVKLTAVMDLEESPDPKTPGPDEVAVLDKARLIMRFLFDQFPEATRIELKFSATSTTHPRVDYGTFIVNDRDRDSIQAGGDIRPYLRK